MEQVAASSNCGQCLTFGSGTGCWDPGGAVGQETGAVVAVVGLISHSQNWLELRLQLGEQGGFIFYWVCLCNYGLYVVEQN